MKILIPARKNSKGLPYKNRKLLDFTIGGVPKKYLNNVFVSTDDDEIKNKVRSICNIHNRTDKNSQDTTSTLELAEEFRDDLKLKDEHDIVMLYLTYPERSFNEVLEVYEFFKANNLKSLLCKKQVKSHPYLCMYETAEGKGKQIVEHNLYRRQDYPKCFEISHYISIFKVGEIKKLNKNMYNLDTYFYDISDKIDVDHEIDLERFLNNDKN